MSRLQRRRNRTLLLEWLESMNESQRKTASNFPTRMHSTSIPKHKIEHLQRNPGAFLVCLSAGVVPAGWRFQTRPDSPLLVLVPRGGGFPGRPHPARPPAPFPKSRGPVGGDRPEVEGIRSSPNFGAPRRDSEKPRMAQLSVIPGSAAAWTGELGVREWRLGWKRLLEHRTVQPIRCKAFRATLAGEETIVRSGPSGHSAPWSVHRGLLLAGFFLRVDDGAEIGD